MVVTLTLLALLACSGGADEIAPDGIERLPTTADLPDVGARLGWILAHAANDLDHGVIRPVALVAGELDTTWMRFHRGTPEEALQQARDVVSGQNAEDDVILVHAGKAQLQGGLGEVWIAEVRGHGGARRLAQPFQRTPLGVVLEGPPLDLPAGEGSGLFRPVSPGAPLPADDPLVAHLDIGWNALPPGPVPKPPLSEVQRSHLSADLPDAWSAAGWALSHALWSVSDGEALATFAVVAGPNGATLVRFTGEEPHAAQATARKHIAEEFSLWPTVLVSQAELDLGAGRLDTFVAEVFRPGAKPRVLALPWKPGSAGKVEVPSLPVFVGGWPSEDRNPVIGAADALDPDADPAVYEAFHAGWLRQPFGKRFWPGP
jgi:hypothetical protein